MVRQESTRGASGRNLIHVNARGEMIVVDPEGSRWRRAPIGRFPNREGTLHTVNTGEYGFSTVTETQFNRAFTRAQENGAVITTEGDK